MLVPAEICIEKPSDHNNWRWTWAVCQPDACWGEWAAGTSADYQSALRTAQTVLYGVWVEQGVIRRGEPLFAF